jgi:hypothetical protein
VTTGFEVAAQPAFPDGGKLEWPVKFCFVWHRSELLGSLIGSPQAAGMKRRNPKKNCTGQANCLKQSQQGRKHWVLGQVSNSFPGFVNHPWSFLTGRLKTAPVSDEARFLLF